MFTGWHWHDHSMSKMRMVWRQSVAGWFGLPSVAANTEHRTPTSDILTTNHRQQQIAVFSNRLYPVWPTPTTGHQPAIDWRQTVGNSQLTLFPTESMNWMQLKHRPPRHQAAIDWWQASSVFGAAALRDWTDSVGNKVNCLLPTVCNQSIAGWFLGGWCWLRGVTGQSRLEKTAIGCCLRFVVSRSLVGVRWLVLAARCDRSESVGKDGNWLLPTVCRQLIAGWCPVVGVGYAARPDRVGWKRRQLAVAYGLSSLDHWLVSGGLGGRCWPSCTTGQIQYILFLKRAKCFDVILAWWLSHSQTNFVLTFGDFTRII